MRLVTPFYLTLSLVLCTLVSATPARALTLDWAKCVQTAQENNAEIAAAKAAVAKAKYNEKIALSGLFPDLNGSLGFNETQAREPGQFSAALSAKQNLFAGGQDISRYRQAQAQTRAAEANLQLISVRISRELKESYAALRYAIDLRRLTKEITNRRKGNAGLVELRFNGGRENKGNLLLAQAAFEQANLDELKAANAQRVAEVALARALGVDEFDKLEITGDIPLTEPTGTPAFREIVKQTPEVVQAQALEEAADRGVNFNRGRFLPTLDLTGTVGESDTSFWPNDNHFWTAGLTLNIPLFAGGENYNQLRSAVADRTQAQHNASHARRLTLSKLEETFAAHVEGVQTQKVNQKLMDAQALRSKIGRGKYGNNLLSFEDWDRIENEFIDSQRNYLISIRDRVVAEAAWEQAQGKGSFK